MVYWLAAWIISERFYNGIFPVLKLNEPNKSRQIEIFMRIEASCFVFQKFKYDASVLKFLSHEVRLETLLVNKVITNGNEFDTETMNLFIT